MTILAPAKINPWLAVLGRRPDGYHEVDTSLLALELHDRLCLERTTSGQIELDVHGPAASPDVPAGPANLAWRALEKALQGCRARGLDAREGIRLELEKRIPSQAGLGGGSADAAAAWVGCELLFELDLGAAERERALAELGSDCVFFAAARETGLARCRGRGEQVEPLPALARDWWIAVLAPTSGASTRAVYAALASPLLAAPASPTVPLAAFHEPASRARSRLYNDLEEAASRVLPDWKGWRDALDSVDAGHFRLSGSGSSFFGLYDEEEEARDVLGRLVHATATRGLAIRGGWVTRPSRRGVRPTEIL